MTIAVCHVYGACSTLMLYELSVWEMGSPYNFEKFKDMLKKELDDSNTITHLSCNYKPRKFSFFMASTNEYNKKVKKFLRNLGFEATEVVHNTKNNSDVQLHFISIPKLFKELGLKHEQNKE